MSDSDPRAAKDVSTVMIPARLARTLRTDRALLTGSLTTFVSRALAKVAQLVFLIVVARFFDVQEFAAYSYVIALAVTFSILGDTGVALAASRDVSAGHRSPTVACWASVPVIGFGGAMAGFAFLTFGAIDAGPGMEGQAVLGAALYIVLNTVFNFAATMLRSVGRHGLEAATQLVGAIGFVTLASLEAAGGYGVVTIIATLCAKELLSALVAAIALSRDIGWIERPPVGYTQRLLKVGLWLALASTALALAMRIPLTVLGNSRDASEVAWFSAPLRLADTAIAMSLTAGFALLPGLTGLIAKHPLRARRLVFRVVAAAVCIGVVLSAIGGLAAGRLLPALFGASFVESVPAGKILMAGLLAYTVLGPVWFCLMALGQERHVVQATAGGVVVSAVLALLLVPGGGAEGAAWTYLLTMTGVASFALLSLVASLQHLVEKTA